MLCRRSANFLADVQHIDTANLLVRAMTSMIVAYDATCCLQKIGGPDLAVRESVAGQRLRADFDAVARFVRWYVSSVADNYGIEKVFVQVVDIFNDTVTHRGGDA